MIRRWNAYWFAPGRLIDLAMCRLVIVGYQLYVLMSWNQHGLFEEEARRPDELYDALPVLNILMMRKHLQHIPFNRQTRGIKRVN